MQEQINEFQWVSLSAETRYKLREIFLIPHSSHARVTTDNMGKSTLETDGTTNEDLKQLSVEKMRDFLGTAASDETVYDLFKQVVEKIEKVERPLSNTSTPESEPITGQLPTVSVDSKAVGNTIKCEKCDFESASKFAMRMHVGKKHK